MRGIIASTSVSAAAAVMEDHLFPDTAELEKCARHVRLDLMPWKESSPVAVRQYRACVHLIGSDDGYWRALASLQRPTRSQPAPTLARVVTFKTKHLCSGLQFQTPHDRYEYADEFESCLTGCRTLAQFEAKVAKVNMKRRLRPLVITDYVRTEVEKGEECIKAAAAEIEARAAQKAEKNAKLLAQLIGESAQHAPLVRVFSRNYKAFIDAAADAGVSEDADCIDFRFTTTGVNSAEMDDGTTIDVPWMRGTTLSTGDFAIVVRHDGGTEIGWRRPVVERSGVRRTHVGDSVVLFADILIREGTGDVYVTPAGAAALPFFDKVATGRLGTFAKYFDHCVLCGQQLTRGKSIDDMVGPVCAGRLNAVNKAMLENMRRSRPTNVNDDEAAIVRHAFLRPTREAMDSAIIGSAPIMQASQRALESSGDADGPLGVTKAMIGDDQARLTFLREHVQRTFGWDDERSRRALYELGLLLQDALYFPAHPADVLDLADFLLPGQVPAASGLIECITAMLYARGWAP